MFWDERRLVGPAFVGVWGLFASHDATAESLRPRRFDPSGFRVGVKIPKIQQDSAAHFVERDSSLRHAPARVPHRAPGAMLVDLDQRDEIASHGPSGGNSTPTGTPKARAILTFVTGRTRRSPRSTLERNGADSPVRPETSPW